MFDTPNFLQDLYQQDYHLVQLTLIINLTYSPGLSALPVFQEINLAKGSNDGNKIN